MFRSTLLAAVLLLAAATSRADTVELRPEGSSQFGVRNVFMPLRSLVSGPGFWYGERRVEVDTSPPGATIDLFYVRSNFQKAYKQTTAPATVLLPSRSQAGPRDSVTIRAFMPGHRSKEVRIPIAAEDERVTIELDPLPNRLEGAAQSYFAGRSSLTLFTRQVPVVRVQERPEGFTVVLNETAEGPDVAASLPGLVSPLVEKIDVEQLGEDLLLRVDLSPAARSPKPELRSRQGFDAARQLHAFVIDLVPPATAASGAAAPSVERMQAALAAVGASDVTGCALAFDSGLRDALDPGALARALSPTDYRAPFLRAAMRRLGEVSPDGVITMTDGSRFDPASSLELAAAASQPNLAQGYLALLRRVTEELETPAMREAGYRSLVAPELAADSFEAALARANAGEQDCRSKTR